MERGQLLAKRHATAVLQGNSRWTTCPAKTVQQESTQRVSGINANHAAKERFRKRNRRHVPSVKLGNTPIAKTTHAHLAWKAHTLLDLWTNARSAKEALIQGLARKNATSVVQDNTLTRQFYCAQIAVLPFTLPAPILHAGNAQPANIQASRKPFVGSAYQATK